MTAAVVKPSKDEDFYVIWSDNVEAPFAFGDRAYISEWMNQRPGYGAESQDPEFTVKARLDRAEQTGTSYLWPSPEDPAYGWNDDGFIYQQQGILRRSKLKELCERLGRDENADCRDLLDPFEDHDLSTPPSTEEKSMTESTPVIQLSGDETDPLKTAIFTCLGAASMCWEPTPGESVFQSEQASAIGDELFAFIKNHGDGYHSFAELYAHRHALFIALAKAHPHLSWRAKQHPDGTMFAGMFIAGIHLPTGDISYHLPMSEWDALSGVGATLDKSPEWDGHDSAEVVRRLNTWHP